MLDGLEAVEIKLEDLERTFRLDSEFYKKEYLQIEEILQSIKNKLLTDIVNVSDGNHMSISNDFTEKGVPYYRGQDVSNFFIEQANPICITNKAFDKPLMKRSHLKQNDILLSIVGTIGKLSLVKEENKATCNCKLAILRPKQKKTNFLSIILQSKYGQKQIERLTRGAVQKGLILEDMDQLIIPDFKESFQEIINTQIESSYKKLEESKKLYKEAEELLLQELDLLDFEPSQEKVSIKSFDESFGNSGRLDSEYYQPKYDEILIKIKNYIGGYEYLQVACKLKDKNYKPNDSQNYQYIELSNIGSTGDITGCTIANGKELPSRARRKIELGDVIVSSIEGSLEKVALVTEKFHNSLCSTGFYVVNSKVINSATLLVLLKNSVMQQILKQKCSGTILTAINKDDFLGISLPIINKSIQTQIEEKIKESFTLKEESKQLLEIAKRSVEIAIEEDEKKAFEFINRQTYK